MKNVDINIKKISSEYVKKDCVQIPITYIDNLTIFNRNSILYHHDKNNSNYVNEYLNDNRRAYFSHNNISEYKAKVNFAKCNVTKQIFTFNESYILIRDNEIIENQIIANDSSALLVSDYKKYNNNYYLYKTRKELEAMFNSQGDYVKKYIITSDGNLYFDSSFLPTEEEFTIKAREKLLNEIAHYEEDAEVNYFIKYFDDFSLELLKKNINNMTVTNLSKGCDICNTINCIEITNESISIKKIAIKLIGHDIYKLYITSIPTTKYALSQIKHIIDKAKYIKQPKVSLKLNQNIAKEILKEKKKI